MRRISVAGLVYLVMALFAMPDSVLLAETYDDFNDKTLDYSRWVVAVYPVGVSISETNHRMEVAIAGTAASADGDAFGADYISACKLRGNFDIQVDYQLLTWPTGNGVRTGLGIMGAEGIVNIERTSFGDPNSDLPGYPREVYVMGSTFVGGQGITETTDLSGKVRLVRQDNLYSAYYMGTTNWILVAQGPGPTETDLEFWLGAWSHDYVFMDQAVKVARDNMVINSGQLVCPLQVDIALNLDLEPDKLNPKRWHLPVWILNNEKLDATKVDPTTVRFGNFGTETPPDHWALQDVDRDGDLDLKLQFLNITISCHSTAAVVTGQTLEGVTFRGVQPIATIGCHGKVAPL